MHENVSSLSGDFAQSVTERQENGGAYKGNTSLPFTSQAAVFSVCCIDQRVKLT